MKFSSSLPFNLLKSLILFLLIFFHNNIYAQNAINRPEEISLQVQIMKNGKSSGVQEYTIKNNQSIFVPVNLTSPEEEENKAENATFNKELGGVAEAIVQKTAQIQRKQYEIDTELYPVYRAPLETEKRSLELELQQLLDRKTQLESEKIASDAFKPRQQVPKVITTTGITIKAFIDDNGRALITVSSPESNPQIVQAPLNQWVVLYETGVQGAKLELLAKVSSL